MIKDYIYLKTPKIASLITQINTYRDLFEKIPKLPHIQENLLRKSTLKSSLYSARIEGNRLEMTDVEFGGIQNREKREVFQIFDGLKFARSFKGRTTKEFILELHQRVMDDLTAELGRFRTEPSAIFNTAGVAIYVAPSAQKVPILVGKWLQFVNRRNSNLCDIAITHFVFEKIHPFLDGNGRVGRILMNWQLQKLGYGFAGLISFEDYLEQNRNNYYSTLAIEKKDITEFVEFILETVAQSAQKVILQLQKQEEGKIEDILLPRRAEILAIIREHQVVTFDQIHRRFLSVNSRTLHYDLQDLVRKGLIRKRGATRGSVYAPK
ncbi:MAG: hypothetical protein A3C27_03290 [Candidatus Levybacteria bacterium RIFCSPHIGHO2_02_FULL_39_36]|nr:MAG: Filamentation induced by cAMP protein Fic [Candidatus Levybacteria bacterium GW2011_GWA1_39_11]KKR24969.1 MAG: Filamentation induced by cAMP protein Fic [Candidatus Levybacteria bacterium GW2011_GWB1_39_7]KKR49819.1 MAG: Filamentation induced by cAMP protein Fic [Candidatus Levybacteria bacterium GW2011_GWA2_40_16]OGH14130.1 MAG: hypothetical protein A2689_00130 [Candidatus Levybacteria bacterium RIFCSPHIGHO2_01_FULL_38_96]OGH25586.1 MAG: hypothetical protein A3E68_00435 [Candidatus Lev